MSPRHHQILKSITYLPQKILSLHGTDNVTEFVLHTLCNEECFNLSKAAYLIDNFDFNCLKGVAGFAKDEEYGSAESVWDNPKNFTEHMGSCKFNQQVRGINRPSSKRNVAIERTVEDIASHLEMDNPSYYTWTLKYDNHGILLFEHKSPELQGLDEEILRGLSLLGFCPVF